MRSNYIQDGTQRGGGQRARYLCGCRLPILSILICFYLFSFVSSAPDLEQSSGLTKEYTPTSDKVCENGKCNLVLYGGTRNVYEDKEWKRVEDARSLMDSGIEIEVIEYDTNYPLSVVDYNLTSITLDLQKWAFLNTDIPLDVYSPNNESDLSDFKNTYDKKYDSNVRFNIFDLGSKRVIVPITLGEILVYGKNSTTISLKDADSEILNDQYYSSSSPNYDWSSYPTYYALYLGERTSTSLWNDGWDATDTYFQSTIVTRPVNSPLNYDFYVVVADIWDCYLASNITAKVWDASTYAVLSTGSVTACAEGSGRSFSLEYSPPNNSNILIGLEADQEVNWTLDTIGETTDWVVYNGSWYNYDDVGFEDFSPRMNHENMKAFIEYNTSAVPDGATIDSMSLTLFFGTERDENVSVYDANDTGWDEENFIYGELINSSGVLDSLLITAVRVPYTYDISDSAFSSTDDAWTFMVDQDPNNNQDSDYYYVYGKEYYDTDYRAVLNITYTEGGGDSCTCTDSSDWEIDMTDDCTLSSDCAPNDVTFINTGTFTCNAKLNVSSMEGLSSGQAGIIGSSCQIIDR